MPKCFFKFREPKELCADYRVGGWSSLFLVKTLQGYILIDMSVSAIPTRQAAGNADTDLVVALVKLKRGDTGGFRLHDAESLLGKERS